MKNIVNYITEVKFGNNKKEQTSIEDAEEKEFPKFAEQCLGNNSKLITSFESLLKDYLNKYWKGCKRSDLLELYETADDIDGNCDFYSDLEEMTDESESYYDIYYNAYDNCKGIGTLGKQSVMNKLIWAYLKDNLKK